MPKSTRLCDEDGCDRKHVARGLCKAHWKREHGKPVRYAITCHTCGAEHMSARKDGRFCSDECKGLAYQRDTLPHSRELVLATADAWCSLPAGHPVLRYGATQSRTGRRWTEIVTGPCAWCRAHFTAPTTGAARYCSLRCARRQAKAKGGRFIIPRHRRVALYARDEWTCQLCLEPVDPSLMDSNPYSDWAPSLDHIQCQAWTSAPDHSDANLRLAHRWCNAVRGDERWHDGDVLRISPAA